MNESKITINGARLTVAESCTVRVAINAFLADCSDEDHLGVDEVGRAINKGYYNNLKSILTLMQTKI